MHIVSWTNLFILPSFLQNEQCLTWEINDESLKTSLSAFHLAQVCGSVFILIFGARTHTQFTSKPVQRYLAMLATTLCHCGWRRLKSSGAADGWRSAWGKHNVWHLCQTHNHWVQPRVLPILCWLAAPLISAEGVFPTWVEAHHVSLLFSQWIY